MKKLILYTLILLLMSCRSTQEVDTSVYMDAKQPVDKRVEALLAQMTLEEKVGQRRTFFYCALITPFYDFFHRSIIIRPHYCLYIVIPVIFLRRFGLFEYHASCHCVRSLYVRVIKTFNLQGRSLQMQFLLYFFHQAHTSLFRIQFLRLFHAVGLVLLHVQDRKIQQFLLITPLGNGENDII